MVGTRANENNPGRNEMDELRQMVRALTGAVATQQEAILELRNGRQAEERREVPEEEVFPVMQPMANLTAVKEFLKLKPPTFKGGMDPVQTNGWIAELEKNFELLQCSDQQKVKIGAYLLNGEANRWWSL